MQVILVWLLVGVAVLSISPLSGEERSSPVTKARQLAIVTVPDRDSFRGEMRLFSRNGFGQEWQAVEGAVPILVGRRGVAWGRGLHPPQSGLQKREGDGRAPAGRFRIGKILGNAAQLPEGARWQAFHQKTGREAWVDDPELPEVYNRLWILPPRAQEPPWFEKHRMKLDDPAYEWLVTIEHNMHPPLAGAGSAIFFHVRRGVDRPSAGCTVMAREDLERLICWLDPQAGPEMVLLARADYERLAKQWGLPEPGLFAAR